MFVSQKSRHPSRLLSARFLFAGVVLVAILNDGRVDASTTHDATRAEQKIPFKRSDESTTGLAFRVVGGLIVTVLIGFGVLHAVKRFYPTIYRPTISGESGIHVLEVRRLTPKTTLFLVELSGARLLIGETGDGVRTLYQFPAEGVSSTDTPRV